MNASVNRNENKTKVEIFDHYFDSFEGKITCSEVCSAVQTIYGVEIETAPL